MTAGLDIVRRLVLDARLGWPAAASFEIAVGDEIRLADHPVAPDPIADPSNRLGGLSGPIWAAVFRAGALVILDKEGARLLAFDPCDEAFHPFACFHGPGSSIGALRGARGLAVDAAGRLVIADTGNRRVQVYDPRLSRITQVIGPFRAEAGALVPVSPAPELDPDGLPTGALTYPTGTWEPTAALPRTGAMLWVADRAGQAIHRIDPMGRPAGQLDADDPAGRPLGAPVALTSLADGSVAVIEEGEASVRILDPQGRFVEDVALFAELEPRAFPPVVAVDADGSIWISPRVPGPKQRIRRDATGRCTPCEQVRRVPAHCPVLAFDRDGAAILGDARQPCLSRAPARAFATDGTLYTTPLDSRRSGCVWDRIALTGRLPEGSRLTVASFTAEGVWTADEIATLPEARWTETRLTAFDHDGTWNAAIRSAAGRYLWLRLRLSGDGAASPSVSRIDLRYPRNSLARHLPTALAPDPASHDFLERFMDLFGEIRSGYTEILDDIAGLFDPCATPTAPKGAAGRDFLDWLGGWLGLTLERNWPVEARRRLVREAARLYRMRGTPEGVKRHVELYTGIQPQLIEHFRLRRWMALGQGRLGADTALWGPEAAARLELDAYDQIGRFVLVDSGDPLLDPFNVFAHRATLIVAVPPGPRAEREVLTATLERIVAAAAPAHVAVEIRVVEPDFVIGCGAIIGTTTRLRCEPGRVTLDETELGPPVRLAGAPRFQLGPRGGARLGTETHLTG
ncbi:phage tail protein [Oceaniovalibus sp. ACAM 378]|uniref:phage tail protein n=1 Tax=Oceaniovalibus sp. ACAM 378 TaxID=2599923 RepID=UPI0011D691B9|nr:phage tail protein [Oceaniovalibus sp. ACAM 378]TYB89931.1 hypothetical protein FQ320_07410 [Oceaniovalibus sp. ACAM 378]